MDFKTFLIKKVFISYFISVTCISAVMAVIGMIYEPDVRFGYGALLSPHFFGLVSIIPSLLTYSKKELTVKQMMIRKLLQFLLLEGSILTVLYFAGALKSVSVTVSLALGILVIIITVYAVSWIGDKKTATQLNSAIKRLQMREKM